MIVTVDMVYELTMTNSVVMFQETDGILARFVFLPVKRLLINTDYFFSSKIQSYSFLILQ